jgi:hypothetical protein
MVAKFAKVPSCVEQTQHSAVKPHNQSLPNGKPVHIDTVKECKMKEK